MKYFSSLSKKEFNEELTYFLSETDFNEVEDLSLLSNISGYYIMILDEYKLAYIGRAENIKSRIQNHWSKQKEFDRLIFGKKENSIMSIDSYRAYDTTRIFVYPTNNLHGQEDNFINMFDNKYLLNRTSGGNFNWINGSNH